VEPTLHGVYPFDRLTHRSLSKRIDGLRDGDARRSGAEPVEGAVPTGHTVKVGFFF
jgi:hypothetical protein